MNNANQATQAHTPAAPPRFRKLSQAEYDGSVKRIDATHLSVASSSRPWLSRIVTLRPDGSLWCSCPAKGEHVHTRAVRAYIAENEAPIEIAVAEPCGCPYHTTGNAFGCSRNAGANDYQAVIGF